MQTHWPDSQSSLFTAVGAVAANISTTLNRAKRYVLVSTTACFIKQSSSAPTATAGAGSMYVPANTPTLVFGAHGTTLSIVRASADGSATLTELVVI